MQTALVILLLTAAAGGAAEESELFRRSMLFPGPNPTASDLLPDHDDQEVFQIGQILFAYPPVRRPEGSPAVSDLSKIQSVAKAVRSAKPDAALRALVRQQLGTRHRFHFAEAALRYDGNAGSLWHITWNLFPARGGFSGVPYTYTALVTPSGRVIEPERFVSDAYVCRGNLRWLCSTLRLSPPGERAADELAEATIRERATRAMKKFLDVPRADDSHTASPEMRFADQRLVRIPSAVADDGSLVSQPIWAVSFREPADERDREESDLFTVWVTGDGRVADLRVIELELSP